MIVELTLGNESAAALAEQMAKELGTEIERPAANLLAEIVNSEPARIRVEMQKLAAYVQGRGRVTSADVEELVPKARKNTVWQLADMLATRRRADAFEFLENLLREGEEPIGLVGVLAWMYRKLIEARDLPPGMNGFQAARPLGMRPDAAEAAVRNAHRIPKKDLLAGLLEPQPSSADGISDCAPCLICIFSGCFVLIAPTDLQIRYEIISTSGIAFARSFSHGIARRSTQTPLLLPASAQCLASRKARRELGYTPPRCARVLRKFAWRRGLHSYAARTPRAAVL